MNSSNNQQQVVLEELVPKVENPMLFCEQRNRSDESKQVKSQFYRQSQKEEEKKQMGKADKAAEYGNPDYVCFKIGQLEFFAKAAAYAQHSQYFSKMQANMQMQHQAEELKAEEEIHQQQIVMRLPKGTLPSVLLIVLQYIEMNYQLDTTMDLQTAFEIAKISDDLKMRKLESELLCDTIMQLIDKHNVVQFLNTCHEKVTEKRKQYRGEVVIVPPSDSESEQSSDKEKKRIKRKRDQRRRNSSDSESMSESSSSCEDISDSESIEKSKRAPKMVQMNIPFDKNEVMEELKESEESWKELNDYCIDIAANNLNFIMEKQVDELVGQVKTEIMEQIIEKHMHFYRANPSHDNRSLIDLLKRVKNCHSVFELLRLEKARIMEEQRQELQDIMNGHIERKPILTWSVSNLTNYFYKQSNSIQIDGANWRLALSYFKKQSTCLKVDIKIMNSPFDTKKAKEYYGKQSLAVPANLDVQKIDPMAQFEVEEVDVESQQQRVNQLNAAAARFTNHSFVSFAATVDLFQDQPLNLPMIHSIICSQKQPVQLISVEDFDIAWLNGEPINVSLKFSLKEMHSQLLSYISKNFTYLMHEPEIRFLSKEDFKLLLRHKYLNVTQEDEVLKAISLWLEGQTLMLKRSKYANVPKASLNMVQGPNADYFSSDGSSDLEADLQAAPQVKSKQEFATTMDLVSGLNEILANVNWDYVTLPCLLDILRSEPLFRKCDTFRAALKAQFNIRLSSTSVTASEAANSQFNNEPRFSYKYNMSQRNLYPENSEAEKIVAKPGSKSQFQLLYPVEVYPDFMAHLIDCMINPMDIVNNCSLQSQQNKIDGLNKQQQQLNSQLVKKRLLQQQLLKKKLEMKHIEDQLQAMDLLDNLHGQKQNAIGQSDGRFNKLNDDIEKAKRLFKMRIDNQARRPAGPGEKQVGVHNSGRMHISTADDHSSGSDSDDAGIKPEISSDEESEIDENKGEKVKRNLSDCVEEKKEVHDDEEHNHQGNIQKSVKQAEIVSVNSYHELQAKRKDWSQSQNSQVASSVNAASSQQESQDDSSSVNRVLKLDSAPVVYKPRIAPKDGENSYRLSCESDQPPYNSTIVYENQLDEEDLRKIPLSNLGSKEIQLKSDVDKHLKAIYKFPSQRNDQNSVGTGMIIGALTEKETQTRNIIYREAQVQTEIDIEFMMQLQDQLRHQNVVEKQVFAAQNQLIKWVNEKQEKGANSSALTQEQLSGLEIVNDMRKALEFSLMEINPAALNELSRPQTDIVEDNKEISQELSEKQSENHSQTQEMIFVNITSIEKEKNNEDLQNEIIAQAESGHIKGNESDKKSEEVKELNHYSQIDIQLPYSKRSFNDGPQDDDLEQDENHSSEGSVTEGSSFNSSKLSSVSDETLNNALHDGQQDLINNALQIAISNEKLKLPQTKQIKHRGKKQAAKKRKIHTREKKKAIMAKTVNVIEKNVRAAKAKITVAKADDAGRFVPSGIRLNSIPGTQNSDLAVDAELFSAKRPANRVAESSEMKQVMLKSTQKQQKLEKFLNKHGVNNNEPLLPPPKKRFKFNSESLIKPDQQVVKQGKKVKKDKSNTPKKNKAAAEAAANFLPRFAMQDEEPSESVSWRQNQLIDDDSPQKAQDASPSVRSTPVNHLVEEEKVPEKSFNSKTIQYGQEENGLILLAESPLRRSQTVEEIASLAMEKLLQNQIRTVPIDNDDEPSEAVKSIQDTVNKDASESSTPLDQDHPLFGNNSSDIYQDMGEGLMSGTSESEAQSQSQSSQSMSTPMSKSDYFTSREAGLACFNILDHLRQNKGQQEVSKKSSEEKKEQSGRIQLKELREHHIKMKQQHKDAKKKDSDES